MKYSITFGICTYNRKDILIRSARSLKAINRYNEVNVRIYDDASTEYGEEFLRELFPEAKSIHIQKKNTGADKNTSEMYEDFLDSGDDILFNADSDLLYSKELIPILEDTVDKTDGFFSVFNTLAHKSIGKTDDGLVIKKIVGAAGCCVARDIVVKIMEYVKLEERSKSFDTKMCIGLYQHGTRILTTKKSYVQHMGVSGFNTDFFAFDYGMGFDCDSIENGKSIEAIFERYIQSIHAFKSTKIGRVYYLFMVLYRKVNKLKKMAKRNKWW